jgi:hypothetical protein
MKSNFKTKTMKKLSVTKSNFSPGASRWLNQQSFIHLILNFTTMKKLIFLFMFLAFLAGTNQIYAQATPGSLPRPLSCTTDPWNPIAGVPYNYSADVNPLTGEAYWYATESTTFMTGGVRVATEEAVGGVDVAAATNYMAAAPVNSNPTTTSITWTSQGLADNTVLATDPPKLFVVVEYEAPVTGCANNMKVYPIRPINAFTVDIMNIEDATKVPLGYDVTDEQCIAGVVSAQWTANPVPNGSIDYDFGADTLYFEVIAANFTDSYTPSFQISGLLTVAPSDQTADIDWGYVIGTYNHNVVTGAGNGNWIDDEDVLTNETNTSGGVSIYVRVIVHNNDTEGLAQIPITLAVDAVNSAGQPDVATNCTANPAFADAALQNVNPRPTVTPVAPGVFLPVAP